MKSRRQFIQSIALTVVALPFARTLFSGGVTNALAKDAALPAGATAASESDPVAAAIGYKADPKTIDLAKYPQRKKKDVQKQNCGNCALYTATNEGWGKCQMITTGLVNAKGWCGSWSAKT